MTIVNDMCVFPSFGSWAKNPCQTGRHFFMAKTLANQGDLEKQGDGVDQRANGNTDLEGGKDGGLELHIDYPSTKHST